MCFDLFLSSDAIGMALGVFFGVFAGLPVTLLVLASGRRRGIEAPDEDEIVEGAWTVIEHPRVP